jgi:hypothetical protein
MGATKRATAALALARFVLPAACVFTLTVPLPAAAATVLPAETAPDDAVELSVDQVHWAKNLAVTPYPEGLVWVPGDSQTGRLWVRTTCSKATGVVTWELNPDDPPVWADNLFVRTRVAGATWSAVTDFTDGQVSATFTVSAGFPVPLDLEIQFPFGNSVSLSTDETQAQQVQVTSAVAILTCNDPDAVVVNPGNPGSGNGSGNGSGLDNSGANSGSATGVSALVPIKRLNAMSLTGVELGRTIVAAAVLTITGTWLVLAVRRRKWGAGDA